MYNAFVFLMRASGVNWKILGALKFLHCKTIKLHTIGVTGFHYNNNNNIFGDILNNFNRRTNM